MVSKRKIGLLLWTVGLAGIAFGMALFQRRRSPPEPDAKRAATVHAAGTSYPAWGEASDRAPVAEAADRDGDEVARIIDSWRNAILHKDADTVVRLDMTFRDSPDRYLGALLDSARSDANERVRAFSARELGKMARPELAPHFAQLLADGSPYVRQNAAWALGELGDHPGARAATNAVVAALERAQLRDPVADVRTAARDALTRLK